MFIYDVNELYCTIRNNRIKNSKNNTNKIQLNCIKIFYLFWQNFFLIRESFDLKKKRKNLRFLKEFLIFENSSSKYLSFSFRDLSMYCESPIPHLIFVHSTYLRIFVTPLINILTKKRIPLNLNQ